ncbi:hypothetical protein [Mycobacterium xenopi]|uniref:hypothetical protein n=1 Tax=Mycobacterium xenopi TaxID=1789 RepID=UPI0022EA6B69|nr:hypothetical protein [Mycobacterium xenopi]MDA3642181.1 hypothetical protein [Mycobacterium xenopi]MDA3660269.1 hypothetical protein [Mycobacterium xenopi]MDA3664907.1 hypothetical protein [Mycobacterium xenopi]
MAGRTWVELEVTDPTDGSTQVFTGADELSVQRKVDEFWGVDEADRREHDG